MDWNHSVVHNGEFWFDEIFRHPQEMGETGESVANSGVDLRNYGLTSYGLFRQKATETPVDEYMQWIPDVIILCLCRIHMKCFHL